MGCAAVFPVDSSMGVARSPRAGVPSIPCVVSGRWWACAGVIRMASDSRFGGVCWGRASPRVVRRPLGVGGAGCSVVVCPSCAWVLVPAVMSSFPAPRSLFPPLPGPWVVSRSHVVSLLVPCPYGRLPVSLGASVPPCRSVPLRPLPSPCPCPFPSRRGGAGSGGGGGGPGPGLGVGGLEPLAEGSGGVGGAKALDRVLEEGLPCRLRHESLRGGLVGVGGGAGAHLLEGVHHVHPFSPSHSPGPLHPAAELLQSGGRPPGEVGGGLGGGGVRARGPGVAGKGRGPAAVAGVEAPGGAGAAVAGLGVEDGYGRRGEREARWGLWGEGVGTWGGSGVLGGAWGSGSGGGGDWGSGPRTGGGGKGKPGGARGGRGWWTWGGGGVGGGAWGSGSGGSGAPEGRGGALGSGSVASEWLRGGGGVGSVSAGGGCAVLGGSGSAAVCRTRPRCSSRANQEVSAAHGGPRGAPPGTGGGGGSPPPSLDPPRRGAAAAVAGGTGRVTVPGGVGPGGPLRHGCGGRGDTVSGKGGGGPWW